MQLTDFLRRKSKTLGLFLTSKLSPKKWRSTKIFHAKEQVKNLQEDSLITKNEPSWDILQHIYSNKRFVMFLEIMFTKLDPISQLNVYDLTLLIMISLLMKKSNKLKKL